MGDEKSGAASYRYREIADDLTHRLDTGEWMPGTKLPSIHTLAREYGVGKERMQEAIALLELGGRILVGSGRAGTVVLDTSAPRQRLDIGRMVRRDELGYLFTRTPGPWKPTSPPTRQWVTCPDEVALALHLPAGSEVLARHHVAGLNGTPMQITTTYLPADLARGTILEGEDTGPGGYLDRLEQDMGYGPLTWEAEFAARLPTHEEATTLRISPRLPVIVIHRLHISVTGRPVAVDSTVLDALRFSVRLPLARHASARWPTTRATARNRPSAAGGDNPN